MRTSHSNGEMPALSPYLRIKVIRLYGALWLPLCGNHRGISLLAAAGKVMLQRLINNITKSMLPESQCGFRKNRSTVHMVFTTLQLQEKCREQHKDLFMAHGDLAKALSLAKSLAPSQCAQGSYVVRRVCVGTRAF